MVTEERLQRSRHCTLGVGEKQAREVFAKAVFWSGANVASQYQPADGTYTKPKAIAALPGANCAETKAFVVKVSSPPSFLFFFFFKKKRGPSLSLLRKTRVSTRPFSLSLESIGRVVFPPLFHTVAGELFTESTAVAAARRVLERSLRGRGRSRRGGAMALSSRRVST